MSESRSITQCRRGLRWCINLLVQRTAHWRISPFRDGNSRTLARHELKQSGRTRARWRSRRTFVCGLKLVAESKVGSRNTISAVKLLYEPAKWFRTFEFLSLDIPMEEIMVFSQVPERFKKWKLRLFSWAIISAHIKPCNIEEYQKINHS